MTSSDHGFFISFEGGEGAGKSTQAKRLASRLRESGYDPLLTREPGGAPRAEALRDVIFSKDGHEWPPIAEALLVYAARAEHLERTVKPALADGRIVVTDRFSDSSKAYQGASGVGRHILERLESWVVGETSPDMTIYIDIDTEAGLARAKSRGEGNSFDERDVQYHMRVREIFLSIASADPDRVIVFDGSLSEDRLADAIFAAVSERLKNRSV